MKKWIIYVLMIASPFTLAACSRQEQTEKKIQDIIAEKTYLYEKDGFGGDFTIHIYDDGTFTYYEGTLSSYIGMGNWTLSDDILVLSDESGYPYVNYFKVNGNDLNFISGDSTNFLYVKVADGERFSEEYDGEK